MANHTYSLITRRTHKIEILFNLPNFLHKTSSCAAAEKGFDILIEKPLGRSHRILRARKLLYKYSKELMTSFNLRKILGFWHYILGVDYCECGDMRQGKNEFVKAITNDPFFILYYAALFVSFFGSKVFDLLTRLLDSFRKHPLFL
jgi:predicted dehydrogenase